MRTFLKTSLLVGATGSVAVLGFVKISQAQDDRSASQESLFECEELLPENKQYSMSINLDLDTRVGQESTLAVTLLDDDAPGSVGLPEGTEEFFRCILVSLGIPSEEI